MPSIPPQSWNPMICEIIGLIVDVFFCCTRGRVGTLLTSIALRMGFTYIASVEVRGPYHWVPLNAVNGPVLVHYLVVLTGLQTS
jgi:hypothetical protein